MIGLDSQYLPPGLDAEHGSKTLPLKGGGQLRKANDSIRKKEWEIRSRCWQLTVVAKIKIKSQ